MTVYRQICNVPTVFENNEWHPDIKPEPGVSWVALEYHFDLGTVDIELFACDHDAMDKKGDHAALLATTDKAKKVTLMLEHKNSPETIYFVEKDGKKVDEG